jgi:hypothetical protein
MSFSNFSVKVLQDILNQVVNLECLNSLALTNVVAYRAFIARRTQITTNILERFLAEEQEAADLESAILKVPFLYALYKGHEMLILFNLYLEDLNRTYLNQCWKLVSAVFHRRTLLREEHHYWFENISLTNTP